ncbi:sigma 54-interacting transcriptional regulator [Candidatus Binatus sp.]|uniref:sigma 54-interacting transcriptional regulator n=1 Tax=Candidatus Binatus sp. TaxID=2811406 RepID=UPI003C608D13
MQTIVQRVFRFRDNGPSIALKIAIDLSSHADAGGLVQHDDTQPPSGTQPTSATANGTGASEMVSLSHLVHSADRLGGMVVRSAQVRKVLKSVTQLSPYKATVLISGESGTGKELVARALHTLGPVPNGPFVTLNCSNLVEALAESQLFGHIRGAFTDARDESQGYFRAANGGTLFLDEIGELPLKLQPKLLRSVETHEVQPVGSSHCYKVNLRLVAATNRDLRAMVKAGTFRDDLYFRMSAAAIFIPPLRERREAIPAFIGYFIEQYNRLFGKDVSEISRAAIDVLCGYQWPGNVRELSNAIESAVILSENNRIVVTDLPEQIVDGTGAELLNSPVDPPAHGHDPAPAVHSAPQIDFGSEPLGFLLDDVIKKTLMRSLEETEGNRRRAADLLGVSRSTLYRMLTRYGIAENPHRLGVQPTL